MVATLVVAGAIIAWLGSIGADFPILVFGATAFIALVGATDDIKTIQVIPRLILQALAVAAVLVATSGHLRIIPAVPIWIEQAILFLAGLWFVNLVNFMDGIDLKITVAEVVSRSPRRAGPARRARRPAAGRDDRGRCAWRRHHRICPLQPAGSQDLLR